MTSAPPAPLVLHVVHRFDTGGLENGVVNLIDHMPPTAYRHAVLAVTEVTDFRHRVRRADVSFHALHKPPGQALWLYPAFMRLLRQLRPQVLHTRNLGTLEFHLPALLAGVPGRVHGEHGRDIDDLDGSSRRHRWTRQLYKPLVQHQIALSRDLQQYLVERIGVPAQRISQIFNGVDTQRFLPRSDAAAASDCPFDPARHWVVGTVGRMQAVKAQTLLAQAFVLALQQAPALRERLRLMLVGDGPLRAECLQLLQQAGLADLAWLPGERSDVPALMRCMQLFVLPSRAEGVSNTILEAMASGLPVLATDVGANADLVQAGRTGLIVPKEDASALAAALLQLAQAPQAAAQMGAAGRGRVCTDFSMAAMAAGYRAVYDRVLAAA